MPANKQQHVKVIAECTEELEACPDDLYALNLRGSSWNELKQYENAIADFDKVLCWAPDRVDALNNRGRAYSGQGHHNLAIADFTKAIGLASKQNDLQHIYFNRGRSQRLKGNHEESIEDFNEAIRRDPQYAKAIRMRGLAWNDLEQFRKAISDFDLSIRIDPKSAASYHGRACAWVRLGKLRKGIADFTRAILVDPNDPKNAATHANRGRVWRRKGKYCKALSDYERALELDDCSAQRLVDLADFLATCPKGRFRDGSRSLQLITEACEMMDHISAEHLDCLASAHAARGNFSSAISFQKKALAIAPEDDDRINMRRYIESYEAGQLCVDERPRWLERWA